MGSRCILRGVGCLGELVLGTDCLLDEYCTDFWVLFSCSRC